MCVDTVLRRNEDLVPPSVSIRALYPDEIKCAIHMHVALFRPVVLNLYCKGILTDFS